MSKKLRREYQNILKRLLKDIVRGKGKRKILDEPDKVFTIIKVNDYMLTID